MAMRARNDPANTKVNMARRSTVIAINPVIWESCNGLLIGVLT